MVDTSTPHLVNDPPLWGRDSELGQLEAILSRRQPALIVVTGDLGAGKSSLLKAFHALALQHGWKTVPGDRGTKLSVTVETTEETFSTHVSTLLGGSEAVEATSRRSALSGEGSCEGRPASPERSSTPIRPSHLYPLVAQLRGQSRQTPVLLLLDGYHPEPRFAQWFTEHFVDEIKQTAASVVVAVACRPQELEGLRGAADAVILLGPLDQQVIRQHLESFGQHLSPPLTLEEIELYTNEGSAKPEVLGILLRVLRLTQLGGS